MSFRCLNGKLWYLQHNCVRDIIVHHSNFIDGSWYKMQISNFMKITTCLGLLSIWMLYICIRWDRNNLPRLVADFSQFSTIWRGLTLIQPVNVASMILGDLWWPWRSWVVTSRMTPHDKVISQQSSAGVQNGDVKIMTMISYTETEGGHLGCWKLPHTHNYRYWSSHLTECPCTKTFNMANFQFQCKD